MVATVTVLSSSANAVSYFEKDSYYAKDDPEHREASFWQGEAARDAGLRGHVLPYEFEDVLDGWVPGTEIRLGRMREGEHDHRPGWDITFSAPKSVSLEGLVIGDRRVIRAHDDAVRATLEWIETDLLQTRGWDPITRHRPRVAADGMIVAGFRHLTSRGGDPQLHTHCVLANMTRNGAGEWRSVEPTAIRRSEKLIGAYYRNELAMRLQAMEMAVTPTLIGNVPGFELAGYEKSFLDAFSGRRQDILAYLEKNGLPYTAELAQMAALATRPPKRETGLAELVPEWREKARALGLSRDKAVLRPARPLDPATGKQVPAVEVPPPDLPANELRSLRRAPKLPPLPGDPELARLGKAHAPEASTAADLSATPELGVLEAVARAVDHASERRTTISQAEIRAVALGHAPGRYTLAEIDGAVGRLVREGKLIPVERRGMDRAFVTDAAVRAERRILSFLRAGRGNGAELCDREEVEERLSGSRLTEGQRDAVRTILLSGDLIVGVQGHAGSGKTTMLREAMETMGERRIVGLAPSAAAARVLEREAGIGAVTLQYFLARHGTLSPERLARAREEYEGAVLAVDECSMIDTVRMESLLRIADALGVARVALVGDTAQLRAVDAGEPFKLLQKAGMRTATMDEVLRQKDAALLRAVMHARHGEAGEAMGLLGRDRVREVPREKLGSEAARRWLALTPDERADTAVMAPTHEIRRQANRAIREGLEEDGILHGKALAVDRLVPPPPHKGAGVRHRELRAGRHPGLPPRRVRLQEGRCLHRHRQGGGDGGPRPPGRRGAPLPALGQCRVVFRVVRHRADRAEGGRPHPLDPQPQGAPVPLRPSADPGAGQRGRGGDPGDRQPAGAVPRRRPRVRPRARRSPAPPPRSRLLHHRARGPGEDRERGHRDPRRRRRGGPRDVPCRDQPGAGRLPPADRRPRGADRAAGGTRGRRRRRAGGARHRPRHTHPGGRAGDDRRSRRRLAGAEGTGRGDEYPRLLPSRLPGGRRPRGGARDRRPLSRTAPFRGFGAGGTRTAPGQ